MSNRSSGCSSPNCQPNPDRKTRFQIVLPMLPALLGAWFGFANPGLHFPAAIILLPWALFLAAEQSSSAGQAFRNGLLATLPGYTASLYWLALPVHDYGGLPWALALPCPVIIGALLAAYAGVFTLVLRMMRSHPVLRALFAGALWATLELIRNYFLTGFPWLTLSSALSPWPWTLGLAPWIGSFGLSGCVVMLSFLIFRATGYWRAAAVPVVLLIILPGALRTELKPEQTASAALIQGNINQDQKWEPTLQAATLSTYLKLSRQAVAQRPDIIIWPETAMPFYFQDPGDLAAAIAGSVSAMGVPLITGSPAYSMVRTPGKPNLVLHNRAYLLNSAGKTAGMYDKQHLVPFGEYVPLGEWIPFITKLVPGEYEFSPSKNVHPLLSGHMSMGMLICYEAIFPELAQQQVADGANVLVNISNDAWFGRSSAPLQHLHLSILRAVEQNRAIIRATNTGYTTFITPHGETLDRSELFKEGVTFRTDVPLLTATTFYHDHFTGIHASFPVLTLLLGIVARGRKHSS